MNDQAEHPNCVFCAIAAGEAPATFVQQGPTFIAFEPLGPQVPGHVLFVPRQHVNDATQDPELTGLVMAAASTYAQQVGPCNIVTSVGSEATQSVFHLHIHVLPRGPQDGLRRSWPWVRTAAGGPH